MQTKTGGRPSLVLDASYIATIHTALASIAFFTALLLSCLLHFKKIVKNDVAQWPDEWWPSVSATIGDWYPERNIFQILIALTSGPRIVVVGLQYYLNRSPTSMLPTLVFLSGIVRTLSCGGWVYITSSDDHDVHDFLMITYIVCNIPWMLGGIACTPRRSIASLRRRRLVAIGFFVTIIPLIYFFLQHKVHRVPGAYTRYSFFEWSLIILDILYDSAAELEFTAENLQITIGYTVQIPKEDQSEMKISSVVSSTPTNIIAGSSHGNEQARKSSEGIATSYVQRLQALQCGIPAQWRPVVSFYADVYTSYIFWSIYTSLVPTLFYFSVWELAIAGSELALLSTFSPILLSIPPLNSWAHTRSGQITLHTLSLLGLLAYALDKPVHRLLVVTFATAVLVIRQTIDWHGTDVGYQGILTGLGLMLSSLSKHANHSNNPVWPIVDKQSGGYNKTGIFFGLLALYDLYTRPPATQDQKERGEATRLSSVTTADEENWLTAAVPLGSLLFSLHCLLSDSSTLIAWSWTGYSERLPRGPQPNLHGSLTLIAQCLGLLLPILLAPGKLSVLSHPIWFIYGAISAFTMYCCKNWVGYAGGLNLAVFLMSIIPHVLAKTASCSKERVPKMYFTAWLVTCLLDLADVWTVAYAFVPGGVYLRERTDLVILAQMTFLSLAFNWTRLKNIDLPSQMPASVSSCARKLLALFSVSSVLVSLYRLPSSSPRPYHPGERILTAGIWTLHFGIDNNGRDSQRRVRDLIHDMQLDIVGLLETDLHRIVYGNRDLTRVVAEELGYYVDLGPGPNSHTWGAVLLSKFPIINSTHHLLPSPRGELAPAIEAWLDVYGTAVLVVIAHNGQEEDPYDRELQSQELARIMSQAYPYPTIFLGYVVTKPGASQPAPYDLLVTDGRMHDVDEDDWDRWCEYIFYRGLYRTVYARVSRGVVTDTELQLAQFVLPKYGYGVTNETLEARMLRSYKEDLPEVHWFPMDYYGTDKSGGKNSHYYHVWHSVR